MKITKEDAKEFLDGPDVGSKFIVGGRYLFCTAVRHSMYGFVCYSVLIAIILLFIFLPWFILVILLGFDISQNIFLTIFGPIGFIVGLYTSIMLAYYFYIAGWQD